MRRPVGCYGQMIAFRNIPAFKDDLSGFAAYESRREKQGRGPSNWART